MNNRELLKDKKRIVVKIGSSSLTHPETGDINYYKMEQLVRTLADIRGMGKDVVLVSSGAIAVGRKSMGIKPETLSQRQALAAIGQAQLMMTYQRLFSEYSQKTAQILMTKSTMTDDLNRKLAQNTFEELLHMGVIPVVNENDTVSTYEIQFGDNDRLSAIVAALIHADLLILLTDQDGMYTDDPKTNPEAEFIDIVPYVNEAYMKMSKSTSSSDVGTGGMKAKMVAARIATGSGADMIITNANHVEKLLNILNGDQIGTLFLSHKDPDFDIMDCLSDDHT